jgi:N-hydroxyarylamine O-acetyltransferase
VDIDRYLARLQLDRPTAATLDWLVAAHRAQAERVPYSTIDIHLGRAGTTDPIACADRVARTGRTGYCFQLNGAFGALLAALGYDVTRHRGHVWWREVGQRFEPFPNHLALTVAVDGSEWFVDAGLGDALHEPLPLVDGPFEQGPFRYRLERVDAVWRFCHDATGAFTAMDFEDPVAPPGAFDRGHAHMSTSPESNFVTNVTVARRDATGADKFVNQTLKRIEAGGTVREVRMSSPAEYFAALADVFGLTLDDLDADDRARLWRDAQTGQAAYEASQAATLEGEHVAG